MLSASVVVAVLLSTHGEEPTREEKFRGALVQVAPEVRGTTSPTGQQELDSLTAVRPSLVGAGVALGIGIAVTAGSGMFFSLPFLIPAFARSLGEIGVWYVVLFGGLAGVGVLTGVIAGVVMAVIGAEQTRIDERIRALEAQHPRPAPAAQFSVPPHLVLARF